MVHASRYSTRCRKVSNLQEIERKTAPEKLKFSIVGFQTAKDGHQTKNPSNFDHANLNNAYVMLNSDRYPAVDYNLSFFNQKFSRVYGVATLSGV